MATSVMRQITRTYVAMHRYMPSTFQTLVSENVNVPTFTDGTYGYDMDWHP